MSRRTPRYPTAESSGARPLALLARIPWTAIVVSVAIVLSSGLAIDPVRDAVTGGQVQEAFLTRPLTYVLIAPVSDVLDTLTLLSKAQHIALIVALLFVFALRRVVAAWLRRPVWRQHAMAMGVLLLVIVITYVCVAVLPRPMASLATNDANLLLVDFHSHTAASHDGRRGWNAERNRSWHRDGGYDVAFITDHGTVVAAEQGMAGNANPVGQGVTLLQGIEVTWTGEHVAILGAERTYRGLLTPNDRDVDVEGLRLASLVPNREPVVIWNHPHQLTRLPIASGPRSAGVRAVEVSNGAPDSMDEVRRQRAAIAALANAKHLAMTGGSDNHGWGRTAPNWTLLIVIGWRALSPDALAAQIENLVRNGGPGATRVVERTTTTGTSRLAIAATIVNAPAVMLTTMSNDERVSWLVWTWAITIALWAARRRRRSEVV